MTWFLIVLFVVPQFACVISFWGRLLRAAIKSHKQIGQKLYQIHDKITRLSSVAEQTFREDK